MYVYLQMLLVVIPGVFGNYNNILEGIEQNILKLYRPHLPPINQSSESVNVALEVFLDKIVTVDVTNELFVAWLDLTIIWEDQRLQWDKELYEGIDRINLPKTKVWIPNLYILKATNDNSGLKGHANNVKISSDGKVTWHGEMKTKTSCQMDVRKFPFDRQNCSITMSTQYQGSDNINISSVIYLSGNTDVNGEWKLKNVEAKRVEVEKRNDFRSGMSIDCEVERQPIYYVYTVIMPLITVFIINPYVFLVKAKSGEKTSTAVTLFLSFTIFISLLSEMVPRISSSIPLVYVLVYVQFQMSAGMVVICILTDRLSHVTKPNFCVRLLTMLTLTGSCVKKVSHNETGQEQKDEDFDVEPLVERLDRVFFGLYTIGGIVFLTLSFMAFS